MLFIHVHCNQGLSAKHSAYLTQEQYIFIHDAVLEAVTYGDTQITARDLREAIQQLDQRDPLTHTTGFENQFKVWDYIEYIINATHVMWCILCSACMLHACNVCLHTLI